MKMQRLGYLIVGSFEKNKKFKPETTDDGILPLSTSVVDMETDEHLGPHRSNLKKLRKIKLPDLWIVVGLIALFITFICLAQDNRSYANNAAIAALYLLTVGTLLELIRFTIKSPKLQEILS